jgi:hypothetical protein
MEGCIRAWPAGSTQPTSIGKFKVKFKVKLKERKKGKETRKDTGKSRYRNMRDR